MGAGQSTPIAGTTHVLYLELATKLLRQAEKSTSSSASLQFNHRQCRYLVTKLETALQSANDSMQLSSAGKLPVIDLENRMFMGTWKYLLQLAMDVLSFIQNCCERRHCIQAASMLINAYEHVVSLDCRSELCIWSFKNSGRIMWESELRQELMNISDALEHRLGELVDFFMKARRPLQPESFPNLQGRELAITLIGELEAALANISVTVDQSVSLVELSVRDQVDLLGKVEQALSSGSISNAEELQMATSLAERFLISVGVPVSNNDTDFDFMRVNCKSLRRGKKLGKGGFGEVYRVQWLGIPAAEKVFIDTDQNSESFWSVFVKEVSMLARQSHPNIVRLLCYVKDVPNENQFKYSMLQELMQKDLTKLIEERMKSSDEAPESPQKFPFSIDEVVDILLQIAEGMDYLHRRKVLHRDLKSQNILVKCEMCLNSNFEYVLAKVADFGISKTKERTITLSHPTWNVGTSRWMAPELIKFRDGSGDWNPDWNPFKCDVYSFGMVSYEVLTGNEPFTNLMPSTMKLKVLQNERPPLPSEYPIRLRSMVHKCWRGEPEERPTFAEICRELRFMKGALLVGWKL